MSSSYCRLNGRDCVDGPRLYRDSMPNPQPFMGTNSSLAHALFAKRLALEIAPALLLDVDAVVLRRLLDVGEGEVAIGIGDALDLVEAGERVAHMARVGQGLLALLGEGIVAVGQIAPCGQIAVLGMGFPRGLHGLIPPWSWGKRKTRIAPLRVPNSVNAFSCSWAVRPRD